MAGISAVGDAGSVSNLQFQNEYQVKVAKLQKDAVDFQGDMAMQLIQSATVAAPSGNTLDIKI